MLNAQARPSSDRAVRSKSDMSGGYDRSDFAVDASAHTNLVSMSLRYDLYVTSNST